MDSQIQIPDSDAYEGWLQLLAGAAINAQNKIGGRRDFTGEVFRIHRELGALQPYAKGDKHGWDEDCPSIQDYMEAIRQRNLSPEKVLLIFAVVTSKVMANNSPEAWSVAELLAIAKAVDSTREQIATNTDDCSQALGQLQTMCEILETSEAFSRFQYRFVLVDAGLRVGVVLHRVKNHYARFWSVS